ncbi:ribonuclease Z [Psychroflexus planctonicus]|uniref:Ribonuclease Z n=1 Tax=Psychroflexus planctonicus TaxID=1526575 RepID=A0ABQ1SCR5_9FLAO|nr:ribonuclease Z [Psychroflexus planctonicus]GGE27955.1 ribonuclease Z [Psychroflexus planctonicus]
MQNPQLSILGCFSASPKANAHPTAQLLEMKGHLFLIDCGEGTQIRMRKLKAKFSRINHIFISHLHGDHFFGLIGLISTFGLMNRTQDLHVYGPKGIKEIIQLQLKLSKSFTSYQLHFHELESKNAEIIFEDEKLSVETIPLNHRIYTNGFLFKEKLGERKLDFEAAKQHRVGHEYFNLAKQGNDVINLDGIPIENEKITQAPDPPKSYAFCSDTAFKPDIVEQIKGVNLLYHESTFLEEHEDLCFKTKHSTAKQAGIIAQKAKVKYLVLGHFSVRYKNLERFKTEAEEVFSKVSIAETGLKIDIC